MTILPLPFLFGYLLFLFLVLLLRLPILCWIEVVRVSIFVLFQILRRRLSALHRWVFYWCRFVINSVYYVEIYFLYTHFGKSFYHEWMWTFLIKLFYFEIIVGSHAVVRNNERSLYPVSHKRNILQKTLAEHHNQEIDIDTDKVVLDIQIEKGSRKYGEYFSLKTHP